MSQIQRSAVATWEGTVREGKGTLSTPASKVLDETRYSFGTRFAAEAGTNPEELLAAAHAGCFSMALAFRLGNAGFTVRGIRTNATLSMALVHGHFEIQGIALQTQVSADGVTPAKFQELAEDARATCLVSKALAVPITLNAELAAA